MEARSYDYIKQFWRENEKQLFSAKETQLYFFFLAECNRQFWRNPFGCSTRRVTNNLGMSRQTLCRVRRKLKERGLITYEDGKNESIVPNYTLLIKADGTPIGTLNGTLGGTADGTIIKTNKTTNNNPISREVMLSLDELRNLLTDDVDWLASVKHYTDNLGLGLDETNIGKQLQEFFLYLQTSGA